MSLTEFRLNPLIQVNKVKPITDARRRATKKS